MLNKQSEKIILEAIQEINNSDIPFYKMDKKQVHELVKQHVVGFLDVTNFKFDFLPISDDKFFEMGLDWFSNDVYKYNYETCINGSNKYESANSCDVQNDLFGKPFVFFCKQSKIYFKFEGLNLVRFFRLCKPTI